MADEPEHDVVELGPRTVRALVAAILATRLRTLVGTSDVDELGDLAAEDADALLARLAETEERAAQEPADGR